ncbi:hypothetical protein [Paraburkholderia sediminicola]|uniref:hypothetical protein n=1 Tax=Paraburkholderia sediminicola TaxID=458836 RepID=UPI0038BB809A
MNHESIELGIAHTGRDIHADIAAHVRHRARAEFGSSAAGQLRDCMHILLRGDVRSRRGDQRDLIGLRVQRTSGEVDADVAACAAQRVRTDRRSRCAEFRAGSETDAYSNTNAAATAATTNADANISARRVIAGAIVVRRHWPITVAILVWRGHHTARETGP